MHREPAGADLRGSPHALDEYGLEPALRQLLERARGQAGLEFTFEGGLTSEPPTEARQIAFRIAQEALTNVLKHARARKIAISVDSLDEGSRVRIRDNGIGFNVNGSDPGPGHLGLAGMRARAHSAGGWCRVESAVGEGTLVEYWVPDRRPHSLAEDAAPA